MAASIGIAMSYYMSDRDSAVDRHMPPSLVIIARTESDENNLNDTNKQ